MIPAVRLWYADQPPPDGAFESVWRSARDGAPHAWLAWSDVDAGTMQAGPSPTSAPATGGVIVPPAVSAAEESRLPIFESVESDWFRRSRQGSDGASAGEPVAAWSSPVDEGWRSLQDRSGP